MHLLLHITINIHTMKIGGHEENLFDQRTGPGAGPKKKRKRNSRNPPHTRFLPTYAAQGPETSTGPASVRPLPSFLFLLRSSTRGLRVSPLSPDLAPNRSPPPDRSTDPRRPDPAEQRASARARPAHRPPTMLRVAGRRLSSALAWRPAAAAAAGARGPLAGALPGLDDDDDARGRRARFAVDSPFFAAARGMRPGRPSRPRSDLRSRGSTARFGRDPVLAPGPMVSELAAPAAVRFMVSDLGVGRVCFCAVIRCLLIRVSPRVPDAFLDRTLELLD